MTLTSGDIGCGYDHTGSNRVLADAASILQHPSDVERVSVRPRQDESSSEISREAYVEYEYDNWPEYYRYSALHSFWSRFRHET